MSHGPAQPSLRRVPSLFTSPHRVTKQLFPPWHPSSYYSMMGPTPAAVNTTANTARSKEGNVPAQDDRDAELCVEKRSQRNEQWAVSSSSSSRVPTKRQPVPRSSSVPCRRTHDAAAAQAPSTMMSQKRSATARLTGVIPPFRVVGKMSSSHRTIGGGDPLTTTTTATAALPQQQQQRRSSSAPVRTGGVRKCAAASHKDATGSSSRTTTTTTPVVMASAATTTTTTTVAPIVELSIPPPLLVTSNKGARRIGCGLVVPASAPKTLLFDGINDDDERCSNSVGASRSVSPAVGSGGFHGISRSVSRDASSSCEPTFPLHIQRSRSSSPSSSTTVRLMMLHPDHHLQPVVVGDSVIQTATVPPSSSSPSTIAVSAMFQRQDAEFSPVRLEEDDLPTTAARSESLLDDKSISFTVEDDPTMAPTDIAATLPLVVGCVADAVVKHSFNAARRPSAKDRAREPFYYARSQSAEMEAAKGHSRKPPFRPPSRVPYRRVLSADAANEPRLPLPEKQQSRSIAVPAQQQLKPSFIPAKFRRSTPWVHFATLMLQDRLLWVVRQARRQKLDLVRQWTLLLLHEPTGRDAILQEARMEWQKLTGRHLSALQSLQHAQHRWSEDTFLRRLYHALPAWGNELPMIDNTSDERRNDDEEQQEQQHGTTRTMPRVSLLPSSGLLGLPPLHPYSSFHVAEDGDVSEHYHCDVERHQNQTNTTGMMDSLEDGAEETLWAAGPAVTTITTAHSSSEAATHSSSTYESPLLDRTVSCTSSSSEEGEQEKEEEEDENALYYCARSAAPLPFCRSGGSGSVIPLISPCSSVGDGAEGEEDMGGMRNAAVVSALLLPSPPPRLRTSMALFGCDRSSSAGGSSVSPPSAGAGSRGAMMRATKGEMLLLAAREGMRELRDQRSKVSELVKSLMSV